MQRLRVLATSFLIFLDEKENLIRLFFRISVVALLIFNIYISMQVDLSASAAAYYSEMANNEAEGAHSAANEAEYACRKIIRRY
ncbi:hypothetical protein [Laribacter hongkongensis]|uniref:hypothetical protein n=1 Tax=Laribacter hongkongensis TaxID=168471 RepID=UPI001EFD8CFE|nr:hypothetical protein [Laribacter hongkongensis]